MINSSNNRSVKPWMLFSLFALSQSTEAIYSTSLPAIRNDFMIDPGFAQLSSSAYFLGFAIGILSLGRVSDIIGRRPIVLGGLALYAIMAILCAITSSIYFLIGLRFFQAIGASVGSAVAQAMSRDCYQGHELAKLYTTLGVGLAVMPAFSSMMSAYIVEHSSWRINFVFTSILSLFLCLTFYRKLNETNIHLEISSKTPFLKVIRTLIADKSVLIYALMVGCMNSLLYGFLIEAPFVLIEKIRLSPSEYGIAMLVLSFAYFSSSLSGRYLLNRGFDNHTVMFIGLMLSMTGCGLLLFCSLMFEIYMPSQAISLAMVLGPFMIHALGHNLVTPVILRFALEKYYKFTGTAGSFFGFIYYIITASMLFVISYIRSDHFFVTAMLFFLLSATCMRGYHLIRKINIDNSQNIDDM